MELACEMWCRRGRAPDPASTAVGSLDAYRAWPLCRNPFLEKLNSARITDSIFGSHFHDKAIVPLLPPLLLFINVGEQGYKRDCEGPVLHRDLRAATIATITGFPHSISTMGKVSPDKQAGGGELLGD